MTEIDCWQYWEIVETGIKNKEITMICLNCSKKLATKYALKRVQSGDAFKPCPKCGGEMRFTRIKKKENE